MGNYLVYDTLGFQDYIQDAMDVLGLTYDVRTSLIPVTLEDLETHKVLIVGFNLLGDMTGIDSDILLAGITGNMVLTGHDADTHIIYGNAEIVAVAKKFMQQAILFCEYGSGCGLLGLANYDAAFSYLPAEYGISSTGELTSEDISSFTVDGLSSGIYDDLTTPEMSNWLESYHNVFTAWGEDFKAFELGNVDVDTVTIGKSLPAPPQIEKELSYSWNIDERFSPACRYAFRNPKRTKKVWYN